MNFHLYSKNNFSEITKLQNGIFLIPNFYTTTSQPFEFFPKSVNLLFRNWKDEIEKVYFIQQQLTMNCNAIQKLPFIFKMF